MLDFIDVSVTVGRYCKTALDLFPSFYLHFRNLRDFVLLTRGIYCKTLEDPLISSWFMFLLSANLEVFFPVIVNFLNHVSRCIKYIYRINSHILCSYFFIKLHFRYFHFPSSTNITFLLKPYMQKTQEKWKDYLIWGM